MELEKACGLRFDQTSIVSGLIKCNCLQWCCVSPIAPLVWLLGGLHVCMSTEALDQRWASQVTYCRG